MSSDFSGLLQKAEQLASEIDRFPSVGGGGGGGVSAMDTAGTADLPRVERNLRQLMDAGQQLFAKTSKDGVHLKDVKASVLLGSKGVDLPTMTNALESLATSASASAGTGGATAGFEPVEVIRDTDVAGFLKNERENAILSVIDETRKETFEAAERLHWESTLSQWDTTKRQILDDLSGVPDGGAPLLSASGVADVTSSFVTSRVHDTTVRASSLDHLEMAYARQVAAYNDLAAKGGLPPDPIKVMSSPFKEDVDREAFLIWSMVSCMGDLDPLDDAAVEEGAAEESRLASSQRHVHLSKSYLEKAYLKYVQDTVYSNLQQAQLGGIPGTFNLVKSFLNVKLDANAPGLEDGLVEGVPVWPMIYFCLRCGDHEAAMKAAAASGPGLSEVKAFLPTSDTARLSPHEEAKVRMLYKRSVRSSTDPYKRAVYCVLGACDPLDEHSEVATSLDDYLWIKLTQVREDSEWSLANLQKMMSEDYGETHFHAFEQPVLYFQVLLLTGQFEAAVDFLFRVDRFRAHGVHVGLALFEKKLLLLSGSLQSPLLSSSSSASTGGGLKKINVARLVVLYTRKFEGSDPKEALNYFYLLRGIEAAPSGGGGTNDSSMGGGKGGGNLFTSCVSELVLESREFDLLLGRILPDGSRLPGLIDKYAEDVNGLVNIQSVIELVAEDSERKGMFEDSVRLYDLAKLHDKVIELLNKLLAQVVTQHNVAESRRDRLQRQAFEVAKRFSAVGHTASKEPCAAFYLLLDLMTFFDAYHTEKFDEALDIITKLKIVPLAQADVGSVVSTFRVLTDEVRRNVPDVLLATMNILFANYKLAKTNSTSTSASSSAVIGVGSHVGNSDGGRDKYLMQVRDQAKAIITFAGMIPYRMPGDTNARLVQMEVLMN